MKAFLKIFFVFPLLVSIVIGLFLNSSTNSQRFYVYVCGVCAALFVPFLIVVMTAERFAEIAGRSVLNGVAYYLMLLLVTAGFFCVPSAIFDGYEDVNFEVALFWISFFGSPVSVLTGILYTGASQFHRRRQSNE